MNKRFIRFLSFVLSLLTVFAICLSAPSKAEAVNGKKIPIIAVMGMGSTLYSTNDDGSKNILWPKTVDTEMISNYVSENYQLFLRSVITQDFTEFSDLLADILNEIFGDVALDEKGDPKDNSRVDYGLSDWSIYDRYTNNLDGAYSTKFEYDWRRSPYDIIGDLKIFIDRVLAVTGATEYALLSRCEGSDIALAYYDFYKDDRITDMIFFNGASDGIFFLGPAFSGKDLEIDPDGLERFLYDFDFNLELPITDSFVLTTRILRQIITELNDVYAVDLAAWTINNVVKTIYPELLPKLLKGNFATFPGFWGMMDTEYFNDAKQIMFDGEEEKYSVFIEKIDRYYENVMTRTDEILNEAKDNGIEISNVCKYGFQPIPIVKDADFNSDMICSVESSSFGATSTPFGKVFDKKYLSNALAEDKLKYISPERDIDASTCFAPDSTWFIKGADHFNFDADLTDLFLNIAYNENVNVNSDPRYPQYMLLNKDDSTLSPLPASHRTGIDNYFDATDTFTRRIKPVFKLMYYVTIATIKVIMPRARIK